MRLSRRPYVQTIGSGDWITTIARLTGTHTGPLPAFLASAPFPATGKGFDVLHLHDRPLAG